MLLRLLRCDFALVKHFFDDSDAVQRCRETGVYRHLGHHLDHRFRFTARVKRAINVGGELARRITKRGQGCNGGEFARTQVELRARDHLAVGKIGYPLREIR